jgi:hypothetical protein
MYKVQDKTHLDKQCYEIIKLIFHEKAHLFTYFYNYLNG